MPFRVLLQVYLASAGAVPLSAITTRVNQVHSRYAPEPETPGAGSAAGMP